MSNTRPRRRLGQDLGRAFWRDLLDWRTRGLEFADVTVYPTQHLVFGNFARIFRGGPDWPYFPVQTILRHCRGPIPLPCDSRPETSDAPPDLAGPALWCGAITPHFGHMIADFGTRLPASGRFDPDLPLVFSIWDRPGAEPPPAFWQMIDHLGIARARVRLVRRPTRFARLRALPQGERLAGGLPSRRHLALLDAIAGPAPEPDLGFVYVSRARLAQGRIAGEGVLERALAAAGVQVFHPEHASLAAQIALYRRARHLVFAEGSALHALQLVGRIAAEVSVLARRPRTLMGAALLLRRTPRLRYLRAVRGLVCGLRPDGRPHQAAGISVLDPDRCLAEFARAGIDLAPHWDEEAFARATADDIAAWAASRHRTHTAERAHIAGQLRALGLPD